MSTGPKPWLISGFSPLQLSFLRDDDVFIFCFFFSGQSRTNLRDPAAYEARREFLKDGDKEYVGAGGGGRRGGGEEGYVCHSLPQSQN